MPNIFKYDDLDTDILVDLLTEVTELYEASEQTLIELELKPTDVELQRSLFRSIHTIKGDLGLVSFRPLLPLMQQVETLLDMLRNGSVHYSSTMSDLVLLTMDQVKSFVSECQKTGQAEYNSTLFSQLCDAISVITPDNTEQHEMLLNDAVVLLDPTKQNHASPSRASTLTHSNGFDFHSLSEKMKEDIIFFRELSLALEKHRLGDSGRTQHMLELVLSLNEQCGLPIAPEQLMVACYLHRFGMGFVPTDDEKLARAHVYKSAKLIEHYAHWNPAYNMIIQYKERVDGSGYPMGLHGEDIAQGASLIAIVDHFIDLSSQSSQEPFDSVQQMKKALVMVNRKHKAEHCPQWLAALNTKMTVALM